MPLPALVPRGFGRGVGVGLRHDRMRADDDTKAAAPGGGADQNLTVIAVPTLMTNGLGWTANATASPISPVIDNNTLTLTYGAGSSARSA